MATLIFDFDGTICDSHHAFITAVNLFSERFGFQKIETSDVDTLRHKGSREVMKALGISIFKLPFLANRVRAVLENEMKHLKPFPEMTNVLAQLKSDGHTLAIITSNSKLGVEEFLNAHAMNVFTYVQCGSSAFGKAKLIRILLRDLKLKAKDAFYVGDETRDLEAARSAGVKFIAVGWGFNSAEAFQPLGPDHFVEAPTDLLTLTQ